MRRFLVDEINTRGGPFTIRGSEARHMTKVLRMGPGERLILMDGKGDRFQAIITSAGRYDVVVTLEKPLPQPPASPLHVTLCPSLLKSGPMDFVIQKLSELGINRILPLLSERTVVHLDGHRGMSRQRHWREIAVQAAKQSDREVPAEIEHPVSFRQLLDDRKTGNALKIILWEEERSEDLKGLLRRLSPAREVLGLVGPEGGFSIHEVEAAGDAGFLSVSLGRRILRAETAAMTLAAILQYEWGDLSFHPNMAESPSSSSILKS